LVCKEDRSEKMGFDFFNVLSLIGGLALFLYGMNVMGDALSKTAGGKMEQFLEKLTSTPIRGVFLGAAVTAVIQSSSATTVMVVGFVNSGIMKLSQAVGIIMGANVGTTVTSWILSLTGIESDNILLQLCKPSAFSPVLAAIGVVLLLFSKSEKKHDAGTILLGFAVLMFGMETMSSAVKPLGNIPEFTQILTVVSKPLLGLLAGALLTAIIQSSSASVGILQALCATGSVSFGAAIPIIMGQNIGTCVTALISGIGAKQNAKRAAFVHLYFNIIGTFVFMLVFYALDVLVDFAFLDTAANAAGIAVLHSIFNIASTILLLPFCSLLEKLAVITVRDKKEEKIEISDNGELGFLDSRFLEKPAFAVAQSVAATQRMAELSREAINMAVGLLDNFDKEKAEEVILLENLIDKYEDELGTYLVKLSSKSLSVKDSQTISIILHCIGDFERISDHAINICESVEYLNRKGIKFSDEAYGELKVYSDALKEIMGMAVDVFETEDFEMAVKIEPLEEVIDELHARIKKNHIKRLQGGKCTITLGIALEDLITNFERVADHCSGVAVSIIQIRSDGFETHEYLEDIKRGKNTEFNKSFNEYKNKYNISTVQM